MSSFKRNDDVFSSMPSLWNDVFTRDIFNWNQSNYSTTGTTIPAVNIKETPETFEVEMAAPGMTKDDFRIELDGNLLTISSEKQLNQEVKDDEKYNRKEFSYQSFQRSFELAKDVVDAERIQGKYENGVLQLIIPKREEVKRKPVRLINIS